MIGAVGKRLVVREIVEHDEKVGNLILNKRKDQVRAEVMSFGSEVDKSISLHDIVILPPETGIQIKINGEDYLSINENQILATWQDK